MAANECPKLSASARESDKSRTSSLLGLSSTASAPSSDKSSPIPAYPESRAWALQWDFRLALPIVFVIKHKWCDFPFVALPVARQKFRQARPPVLRLWRKSATFIAGVLLMGAKPPKIVRKGTSYRAFEAAFPDSSACLDHIFESRFGLNSPCPKCSNLTWFLRVSGTNRYMARCCYDQSRNPLSGTIFARTHIPLVDWFRCILYFTNTSAGISIAFVARHFGVSHKAAFRMCSKIRQHLTALDSQVKLGIGGAQVIVDEVPLHRIMVKDGKRGRTCRLLIATDGSEFAAIPVARGRFVNASSILAHICTEDARLVVRTERTFNGLLNFRPLKTLLGRKIERANDPQAYEFYVLSVFGMKLKQFVSKPHRWLTSHYLDDYIGHFRYLYRRRAVGQNAFWDAISNFPELT